MTIKQKRFDLMTGSIEASVDGEDLDYTMSFGFPQILSSFMFSSTLGFTGHIIHSVYDTVSLQTATVNSYLATGNTYFYSPSTLVYKHKDLHGKIRVSGSQTGTWYLKAATIGG